MTAEYKPPISRDKAIKAITKAFQTAVAKRFGSGDADDVEFNRICDDAHGVFNDHVADGTSARLSKAAADDDFSDAFRAMVEDICHEVAEAMTDEE